METGISNIRGDDGFDILKPGAPTVIRSLVKKHLKQEDQRLSNIKKTVILSELKELKMLNNEKLVSPQRTIRAFEMLLDDNLFKSSELLSIVTEFFNKTLEDEDLNGRLVVKNKIKELGDLSRGVVRGFDDELEEVVEKTTRRLIAFNGNSESGYVVINSKSSSQLIFNPATYKDSDGVEKEFGVKDLKITQVMRLLNTTIGNPEFKDEEFITSSKELFNALSSNSEPGNLVNLEGRTSKSLFDEMIEIEKGNQRDLSIHFSAILKMSGLTLEEFSSYKETLEETKVEDKNNLEETKVEGKKNLEEPKPKDKKKKLAVLASIAGLSRDR